MLSRAIFSTQRAKFSSVTATASKPNPLLDPIQQKTSRLPNGLSVSSVDLQGATSHLVFAFRSGSRYEQHDEQGLVHHLRNIIGTDSTNYLGVRLMWVTGEAGAALEAKHSKDLLLVHMRVHRTQSPVAISVLGEFIRPACKVWDVLNVTQEMDRDLQTQSAYELVVDGAYRAAYRNGPLANPLLALPHQIGKLSHKQCKLFTESRWLSGEAALIGVNIDHGLMLDYAIEHSPIQEGQRKQADPSPYFGGEIHQAASGPLAHVAVVGQGVRVADDKAVAVQAVLCAAMGSTGQYTRNENIAQLGPVHAKVFKASNHDPFQLTPLNLTHSDTGLVGFYLAAEGTRIYPYVKAAVQGLRELGANPLSTENLQIAKRRVEMQLLQIQDCATSLAMDNAAQILAKGIALSPTEFVDTVKQVSADDVKKAASQMCSKLSLSAFGKVNQVPYLDEL